MLCKQHMHTSTQVHQISSMYLLGTLHTLMHANTHIHTHYTSVSTSDSRAGTYPFSTHIIIHTRTYTAPPFHPNPCASGPLPHTCVHPLPHAHTHSLLQDVGLVLEEALIFWRASFAPRTPSDQWEKEYAYNVRHSYGKEGKRADYSSHK
jgi:hypothetical protein